MRYVPAVLLSLALVTPAVAQQETWNQWAGGPRHNGSLPVIGDPFDQALANIVVDPHADDARA